MNAIEATASVLSSLYLASSASNSLSSGARSASVWWPVCNLVFTLSTKPRRSLLAALTGAEDAGAMENTMDATASPTAKDSLIFRITYKCIRDKTSRRNRRASNGGLDGGLGFPLPPESVIRGGRLTSFPIVRRPGARPRVVGPPARVRWSVCDVTV